MKSQGNGTPLSCANNILRIVRGEVPFDRIKGLDPRLIDKPIHTVRRDVEVDARKIVEAYEPRVRFNGITIAEDGSECGGLLIDAILTEKEDG